MYILRIILIITLLSGSCLAAEKSDPVDEQRGLSYSVGYQVGADFHRLEVDIDPETVLQGILDAMQDNEPAMSQEERRNTLVELRKSIADAQKKKNEELAAENLEAGSRFLAENSKKEDVVSLPSGLQFTVLTEGTGESPGLTDMVEVDYRGALIDGTEFDSSYSRGKPVRFRVDGVIRGWTEALQLMKTGGKWRLFIPPDLAYGSKSMGGIGPNSTLVFDVELLSIVKNETADSGR